MCHSAAWLLADFNGLPVKCPGSNLSPHLRKAAGAPEYLGVATYGQPLRVIPRDKEALSDLVSVSPILLHTPMFTLIAPAFLIHSLPLSSFAMLLSTLL